MSLSATSYQVVDEADKQQLRLWRSPLSLGGPLPTVPLWIAAGFSIPLDLETSYLATCQDLRIRLAG